MSVEDYRLFVSEDRCTLVRWWIETDQVEVSTREDEGAIWSPPVLLEEEK